MVISSELRMGQYGEGDHREYGPHFNKASNKFKTRAIAKFQIGLKCKFYDQLKIEF